MENIFTEQASQKVIDRIESLTENTKQKWGKMTVDQMLAHCNVGYEMVYEDKHKKPNALIRFILSKMVKNNVVGDKPFQKNGKTAPQFVVKEAKDFQKEKQRLVAYIQKTQKLGETHFEGKESLSFGKLSAKEWNTMFYKHLDHHLEQFGA